MDTRKARLQYHFADESGSVEVQWAEIDFVERRHAYRWAVRDGDTIIAEGSDLRSGSGDRFDLSGMLCSLLSFLTAFAESRQSGNPDSENWHLFPDALADWAIAMSDELTMAALEIRPEGN